MISTDHVQSPGKTSLCREYVSQPRQPFPRWSKMHSESRDIPLMVFSVSWWANNSKTTTDHVQNPGEMSLCREYVSQPRQPIFGWSKMHSESRDLPLMVARASPTSETACISSTVCFPPNGSNEKLYLNHVRLSSAPQRCTRIKKRHCSSFSTVSIHCV